MILLQLTNTLVSDHDAEARSIVDSARALAEEGHEVTLVTPLEDRPALLDRAPRFAGAAVWPDAAAAVADAAPPHPDARPDLVHVHHPFLVGEEALRLADKHGAPLVFSATLRYENPFPLPPAEAAHLRSFIEKLGICFANRCDVVVAPSATVAMRLFEGGVARPIHVVPEDDVPSARAARLLGIYTEAIARRRARGPVRECGPAGRLRRELALAWNRIHPDVSISGRRPGGVFAGLRGGSALPC